MSVWWTSPRRHARSWCGARQFASREVTLSGATDTTGGANLPPAIRSGCCADVHQMFTFASHSLIKTKLQCVQHEASTGAPAWDERSHAESNRAWHGS